MNAEIHTLTAYHLHFSYMKRNNPLKDELVETIKNGDTPNLSLDDLLNLFCYTSNNGQFDLLSNGGKIILLDSVWSKESINGHERIYIAPHCGKRDVPTQMIKLKDNLEKQNFGPEWASTYMFNIFLYCIDGEYYAVFHRFGGSGCKTVFYHVLNQILKQKGIKMEMNWMPPTNIKSEKETEYEISKISLICEEQNSSDVADDLIMKKKKKSVFKKKLTLNLNSGYMNLKNILHKYLIKEISSEDAMSAIKNDIKDDEYNNAALYIKIGKMEKRVSWTDFEGLIDGFDISDKIVAAGENYLDELKKCSDEFIFKLLSESQQEYENVY